MTTEFRKIFIDSNILIYANVAESPFHTQALAGIKQLRAKKDQLWISRQVLREFIATLTRPQQFSNPQPPEVVIERIRYFQTRFRIAEESATVTEKLLFLLKEIAFGGKQVHDANIMATMLENNITHLFTRNIPDFKRFSAYISLTSLDDVS